jgi:hypothetical protein
LIGNELLFPVVWVALVPELVQVVFSELSCVFFRIRLVGFGWSSFRASVRVLFFMSSNIVLVAPHQLFDRLFGLYIGGWGCSCLKPERPFGIYRQFMRGCGWVSLSVGWATS